MTTRTDCRAYAACLVSAVDQPAIGFNGGAVFALPRFADQLREQGFESGYELLMVSYPLKLMIECILTRDENSIVKNN